MSDKYGFVYLLAHPDMPHVYKVGCTERSPHQRMRELSSSTSVPRDFEMLCYIEVEGPFAVEAKFHQWLDGHRISPGREFFHYTDIRWLAGVFKFYEGALAFVEIDLSPKICEMAEEFDWDVAAGDFDVVNPYRSQQTKPKAEQQSAEESANDATQEAA